MEAEDIVAAGTVSLVDIASVCTAWSPHNTAGVLHVAARVVQSSVEVAQQAETVSTWQAESTTVEQVADPQVTVLQLLPDSNTSSLASAAAPSSPK